MSRRTYLERRTYSARVMRFRLGVYAARRTLSPGCQLLLLRLSDDMDAKCIVSIPRAQLAEDLDAAPPRITEWISEAVDADFLSVVRRARPRVTAVYQGLVRKASEVRRGVPPQRYATPDLSQVRPGVPLQDVGRYAPEGSQEGETSRTSQTNGPDRASRGRIGGGNEGASTSTAAPRLAACEWHEHTRCPEDCANANREAS